MELWRHNYDCSLYTFDASDDAERGLGVGRGSRQTNKTQKRKREYVNIAKSKYQAKEENNNNW